MPQGYQLHGGETAGGVSVIYLLDVNALVGLLHCEHEFHFRVCQWMEQLGKRLPSQIATCAITELGLVRILPQLPESGYTVTESVHLLGQFKKRLGLRHEFLADDLGADALPKWVKMARQTTDGHLVELAKVSSAVLATLDTKIPVHLQFPLVARVAKKPNRIRALRSLFHPP